MNTLLVYYGVDQRWNQALLDKIQKALGRECDHLDGLQADFEYSTAEEALGALLVVRELGVRAEAGGVGEGPPQRSLDEAKQSMKDTYRKMR